MTRTVTEVKTFDRAEIEHLLRFSALAEIVGGIYFGNFDGQTVEWQVDGTARVTTVHTPAEPFEAVPRRTR